jgi:hypothetical protein
MKIIRKKSLQIIREEKATVPELEQAVTDLEIEGYKKDATIAEDEQSITDLEIEVAKLKGEG